MDDLAHAATGEMTPPLPDVGLPPGSGFMDDLVPRPPPLRDGVPLTLSYSDHRWPGCVITESTAIDDQAGLLMWWRHVEPGEDDQDLPQASGKSWHWGGCWNMSEVVGVRYTTMFGDPGREFLQSGSRAAQISLWDLTLDRFAVLLLNPLSITFALAIVLAWQLSEIFPRSGGLHDMARPAREEALHTSIATAAACAILSVVSMWWLGVFSYCAGPKYKGTHLGSKATTRPELVVAESSQRADPGSLLRPMRGRHCDLHRHRVFAGGHCLPRQAFGCRQKATSHQLHQAGGDQPDLRRGRLLLRRPLRPAVCGAAAAQADLCEGHPAFVCRSRDQCVDQWDARAFIQHHVVLHHSFRFHFLDLDGHCMGDAPALDGIPHEEFPHH